MAIPEEKEFWVAAAKKEIGGLVGMQTWEEVLESEATGRILPMVWVFTRKRDPDGNIIKFKARICANGALQEATKEDTFAPVVAWSTVRMFLTLAMILGWYTCSIDFGQAYCHDSLDKPVFCELPVGSSLLVQVLLA